MPTPTRIIDIDGSWLRGVKSDSDPSQLPVGYAFSALNAINLGGLFSCRPGHHCISTLPNGNLQGAAIFRPQLGFEQILVVVDGLLYSATFPFTDFVQVTGVQFSPHAKQVYWKLTLQSAQRITPNDLGSAIEVISPKSVMFIQDGGETAPAWFDGFASGHVSGNTFETPAGGPMEWVGDRLWVAVGNSVQASDVGNPFSFREQIYLGGASAFFFAGEVTAMVKTPSVESPQLMVFTDANASILQANIRDRNAWPTTDNFQKEILQVGCNSHRSALSHYGRVVWWSPSGVAFYDPALSGKITSRLPVRDNEMMVSKTTLSDDLSLVAAGAFGQFLVMSLPSGDSYNRHTWVLNHASIETLTDDSGPSWSGHWIGTRPVEWISGTVAGSERIYHVSTDEDCKNRLWESFTPNRLDNNCPITWAIETRGYFGQTAAIQGKPPGSRCRMAWAEIALSGIDGDVDIGVFYAGGSRGAYKQILSRRLSSARGSLTPNEDITITSRLFALKPQSRVVRTEDANQQSVDQETGSCAVESEDLENIDDSFQLFVVIHGPATVRWIRPFAFNTPEDLSGAANACEDEAEYNAVRFDGAGAQSTQLELAILELSAPVLPYTASRTQTVSRNGLVGVGVGQAESIVSQRAADRVAEIIATQAAESDLAKIEPPILSYGKDFDPETAFTSCNTPG